MSRTKQLTILEPVQRLAARVADLEVYAPSDDDVPVLRPGTLPDKTMDTYAEEFMALLKQATQETKSLHWRWAQLLFYFHLTSLWSRPVAGGHDSFNQWLDASLDWLPFGRAHANKLKQVWRVWIYKLRVHEDAYLNDLIDQVTNIDRLATIAPVVTEDTVREWLEYVAGVTEAAPDGTPKEPAVTTIREVKRTALEMPDAPVPQVIEATVKRIRDSRERRHYTTRRYDSLEALGIDRTWWQDTDFEADSGVAVERWVQGDVLHIVVRRGEGD